MVYFFILLVLFLFILLYFAFALTAILKYRTKVEEVEYLLKKSFIRRYNFIYGIAEYLGDKELQKLREEAIGKKTLSEIVDSNKCLISLIDSEKLTKEDRLEFINLNEEIEFALNEYNSSADIFNKRVFSFFIKPVAKACRVKPLEKF